MGPFSTETIFFISFGASIVFLLLIYFLAMKIALNKSLKKKITSLKQNIDELDDLAKMIIKIDLDLNKAQEQAEKRLNALEALQKTSRLISTTLDETEIFRRLSQTLFQDLGYDKNIVLVYDQAGNLSVRVNIGFNDKEIELVLRNFSQQQELVDSLNQGNNFSSVNAPHKRKEAIIRIFGIEHFVLTSIITQNKTLGFVFVGNRSNASPVTDGDEELIAILANQIGQAIENARLFEEVFVARQSLEKKVLERTKQLQSALDEVQAVSKAKSEFISAVSHELRTPLTSIKGYASILIAGKLGDVPDAVKQRLEKINHHSDNLVQLINNLLDISRIEAGRVSMHIETCNLKEIIDNVRDLLTPQMKDKEIKCVFDLSDHVPHMHLDTSQVERIFINLIGNAIKFTPEGGQITVKCYPNEDNEIISKVIDTGIGISKEDLPKLFNEFYRVDNEVNQFVKGTGLGLALAKKIIEAHGGRIWVTSEPDQGTTFAFSLPIEAKLSTHDKENIKNTEDIK